MAALDFECRYCNLGVRMSGVQLGLAGRHQAANAAIALMAMQELVALGWNLPEADVRRGLANLSWPARIEVISQRPTVVIDAAHNVASVQSLIETLEESFVAQRRILVFATTQDKDVRGMLELLLPKVEAVVFTRYLKNPRAVATEELENLAASISPIPRLTAPTPETAYELARSLSTPEHLICVTGSFYLAAEIRSTILDSATSLSEQVRPLSAAAAQL